MKKSIIIVILICLVLTACMQSAPDSNIEVVELKYGTVMTLENFQAQIADPVHEKFDHIRLVYDKTGKPNVPYDIMHTKTYSPGIFSEHDSIYSIFKSSENLEVL